MSFFNLTLSSGVSILYIQMCLSRFKNTKLSKKGNSWIDIIQFQKYPKSQQNFMIPFLKNQGIIL